MKTIGAECATTQQHFRHLDHHFSGKLSSETRETVKSEGKPKDKNDNLVKTHDDDDDDFVVCDTETVKSANRTISPHDGTSGSDDAPLIHLSRSNFCPPCCLCHFHPQ